MMMVEWAQSGWSRRRSGVVVMCDAWNLTSAYMLIFKTDVTTLALLRPPVRETYETGIS